MSRFAELVHDRYTQYRAAIPDNPSITAPTPYDRYLLASLATYWDVEAAGNHAGYTDTQLRALLDHAEQALDQIPAPPADPAPAILPNGVELTEDVVAQMLQATFPPHSGQQP